MKKMLAILGSPRKNGNVASMLEVAMNRGKNSVMRYTTLIYTKRISHYVADVWHVRKQVYVKSIFY